MICVLSTLINLLHALPNVIRLQWNLSYLGSVGPRGARNFKIACNSELIHELCTWLYKNTGHKYIKHIKTLE